MHQMFTKKEKIPNMDSLMGYSSKKKKKPGKPKS